MPIGRESLKPRASTTQTSRNQRETLDEKEIRLGRELRYLMQDPRYQGDDPDYIAYVQRQYRRVYDNPNGRPDHLIVGRPETFVDSIEPFNQGRERKFRLGAKDEPKSSLGAEHRSSRSSDRAVSGNAVNRKAGPQRRVRRSPLATAIRGSGMATTDDLPKSTSPSGRPLIPVAQIGLQSALGQSNVRHRRGARGTQDADKEQQPENNELRFPDDPELRDELRNTLDDVETLLGAGRDAGYILATEFLQRYISNRGGTYAMPWSLLRGFSFFRNGEKRVQRHYENWFFGDEHDKVFGETFLFLRDGETLKIGTDGTQSKVFWDAVWEPGLDDLYLGSFKPPDVANFERDYIAAFGAAAVKGYGNLSFTRRGDVIHVAGRVDMRFDERYDFEDDFGLVGWVTHFLPTLPSVTASDLRDLELHGLAKPFRVQSSRLWLVTGYITLVDGKPDRSKSQINWQDLDRDKNGSDTNIDGSHRVLG